VRRAFDAIFWRMVGSLTVADLDGELSNLLYQLYRLGELCRRRLAPAGAQLTQRPSARCWPLPPTCAPPARRCGRGPSTPTISRLPTCPRRPTPIATATATSTEPSPGSRCPRPIRMADISTMRTSSRDLPVLDTMRRAFDALAALLR
jgi:hypothetical protein